MCTAQGLVFELHSALQGAQHAGGSESDVEKVYAIHVHNAPRQARRDERRNAWCSMQRADVCAECNPSAHSSMLRSAQCQLMHASVSKVSLRAWFHCAQCKLILAPWLHCVPVKATRRQTLFKVGFTLVCMRHGAVDPPCSISHYLTAQRTDITCSLSSRALCINW